MITLGGIPIRGARQFEDVNMVGVKVVGGVLEEAHITRRAWAQYEVDEWTKHHRSIWRRLFRRPLRADRSTVIHQAYVDAGSR